MGLNFIYRNENCVHAGKKRGRPYKNAANAEKAAERAARKAAAEAAEKAAYEAAVGEGQVCKLLTLCCWPGVLLAWSLLAICC